MRDHRGHGDQGLNMEASQARRGEAWLGLAWQGGARHRRQGEAGRGKARQGKAGLGIAGMARLGGSWRGTACPGAARPGTVSQARRGMAWCGMSWHGQAGQGIAGTARVDWHREPASFNGSHMFATEEMTAMVTMLDNGLCGGKVGYSSKKSADVEARRIDDVNVASYQCAECNKWHVGHHEADGVNRVASHLKATTKPTIASVTIRPINMQVMMLRLIGTSPYMQCRFSVKALAQIKETQEAGSTAKKGKQKKAKNFDAEFLAARHVSSAGWIGVPAPALRNACIDACRLADFAMTRAKMSIFIEADGLDEVEGTPLVKLIANEPEKSELPVRNATGVVDIRPRPLWRKWSIEVRVRYDADQFTAEDVVNLMERAGQQIGIGEGRPFSRKSNGMGFGLFTVDRKYQAKQSS